MPKRLPIVWQGNLVGWMERPSVENWFHDGKWIPAGSEATERFIQHLQETGEALVLLGEMKGRIHEPPDEDSICVKIFPGFEW